jgi:uncharacterized membrane protein (UPF0127 family)
MQGMKFSLDIIWLNSDKEVLKIEKGVSPQTYPKQFCAERTQYVIELNSGSADALGLLVGQKLIF